MPALGRGETSDCTNPVLDIFTQVSGSFVDVASLEFEIYEKITDPENPVKIFPGAGREVVDVAQDCPTGHRLSTGNYVATYTVPEAEPTGTHEIRWFFMLTGSSPEQEFREEFQVLPVVGSTGDLGLYTTVAEMRAEGVPETGIGAVSDARLVTLIDRASRQVDKFTNRFFNPRTLSFTLDGRGTPSIHLDQPIISVTRVEIEESGIDVGSIVVYNRHITEALLEPDDRENPRIEIVQPLDDELLFKIGLKNFPRGQQNIRIDGIFGYTDPDGTPTGRTPFDITEVTQMIVIRKLPLKFSDQDQVSDNANAHRITEFRTRDQSIKYANPFSGGAGSAGLGPFFGDREIDNILLAYRAPPRMRSV
jgi:hypothetical protein